MTIAASLLIAGATLIPQSGSPHVPIFCFRCDEFGFTDFLANIALFVPLGVGFALLGWRLAVSTSVGCAATILIETLQISVVTGRDPSFRDVLANTAGTILGWLLVYAIPAGVRARKGSATRLAFVGALAWLTLQGVGAWLELPSLPNAAYWGQWAPDLGGMRQFRGDLRSVEVNGAAMPTGQIASSDALRDDFRRQGLHVRISATADSMARQLAPIAAIYDGQSREVFFVGETDGWIVFRARRRAADLHLRNPGIRAPFPARPGEPTQIDGSFVARELRLSAATKANTSTAAVEVGPWTIWAHVIPLSLVLDRSTIVLSALWTALLLIPLGFWLARVEWPVAARAATAIALISAGLGGIPYLAGESAPAAIWAASVAGLLSGAVLARLVDGRAGEAAVALTTDSMRSA